MTESSGQPDSATHLHSTLSEQDILLGHHEATLQMITQKLTTLLQSMNNLTKMLHYLSARIPIPNTQADPPTCVSHSADPTVSPAFKEKVSAPPEAFPRELGKSKGFLLQCAFLFERSTRSSQQEAHKISYMIALFMDKALQWPQAVIDQINVSNYSYDEFIEQFELTFCPKVSEEQFCEAAVKPEAGKLLSSRTCNRVSDPSHSWNRPAMKGAYLSTERMGLG